MALTRGHGGWSRVSLWNPALLAEPFMPLFRELLSRTPPC